MTDKLTDTQIDELKRLKAYFPFRIVFGVIDKSTREFQAYAKADKRTMNKLTREGNAVFQLS